MLIADSFFFSFPFSILIFVCNCIFSYQNDQAEDLNAKLLIIPKKENVTIDIGGKKEGEYRSPIEHKEISLEVV